jgi:hypothetical protein
MPADLAALIFCALLGALCVFQLALALGAPLGRFAWGGGHERLPTGFRIGSVISIGIYTLLGTIALQRAGLAQLFPEDVATIGIWVIAGYLGLGILMNAISRSKPERYTMTPLVIVLCVLAIFIALSPIPAASA